MTQPEFNPEAHDQWVSKRFKENALLIAKVALFDELIDMHQDGMCTFDEAIAQYLHDVQDLEV